MSMSNTEKTVKDIRRKTRRKHSTEEMIRIVLEGLRGEMSIACASAKDMAPIGPFSKRHFSACCFSSLAC